LLFAKIPRKENCLVVFESIPLIYRVVKLLNFIKTSFGNVIKVLEKLFCSTNHESDR